MVRVARSSVLHGALAVAVLGGVCAAVLPTSAASAACTGTSTNPGQLVRLAGNDRVATAVAISAAAFADGSAGAVVIARRNGFADGLVGGPLSRLVAGPLLLTETGSLNSVTRSEVQRVLPSGKKVYLLGGEQALSAAVAATVGSDGYSVVRLSGDDRYMTAAAVAARFGQPTTVGIASGEVFADALALSAPAAHDRYPLLLVQHAALTTPTQTYLEQHRSVQRINLAGGTAAVSSRVASQLAGFVPTGNLKRWAGADRYATSVAIANGLVGATPCTVTFASGRTFADALAGSAHAAAHDAPLLLLDARVPDSVRAYLEANPGPINDGFLYGGTAAVSARSAAEVNGSFEPDTLVFFGDAGESNVHHDAIAAQIVARAQAEDVDGLLVLGDNVYPTGAASANDPAFATLYEQPFAALTATHSFYVVLGNHDVLTSNGQPELDYATTHPYWVQPARYYERHLERTCLLGLDTNQADVDATQLAAVSSGCANDVTLLHRVAFGHHPVYSSGTHGLNNDEPWMDAQVRPALEQLGVNFYLSGHDHDFEAIVPQASGINYIISGGASQLRPIAASAQSLHAFSDYHFGKLELYTRYADLTVYGEDGSVRWTHRYDLPTS